MSNLYPTRRNRSLLDQLMTDPFESFFGTPVPASKPAGQVMATDIKESDKGFEMLIDLPGFKKEDVNAELKEGYLTITAKTVQEAAEGEPKATFIRKERFMGSCSRTFYVGDDIEEQDISAKFVDGVLVIDIPKKQPEPKLEGARTIAIG